MRLTVLANSLVIATLAAACRGDTNGGSASPTPAPADIPASGPFSVPTDESVAGLLDDGKVTLAEYEAAFFAYIACLDENGVPHGEPEFRPLRKPPRWTVGIGPYRQDLSDEIDRLVENCRGRYLRPVERAWEMQGAPTEAERQQMQQEVVECFNARMDQRLPDQDALWRFLRENETLLDAQVTYIFCLELIFEGVDHFAMQE